MRKVLVTEFLNEKMSRSFKKVLNIKLKSVLDSLPYGKVEYLNDLFASFIVDFACKIVAGKGYGEVKIGGTKLKDMLDEMLILFSGSYSEMFPKYGWILEDLSGWTRRLNKHTGNYDGLLEMVLDEHIDHTNEDEKDLIDACRSMLTTEEMKGKFSLQELGWS
ncbi:hypothetical protein L1987_54711 [Smallanthus sonchifolius]|uniref:Uncharacterized protein n=1 Tax=Smallanthus sonchifolius TaxID=185202 RepID=A0ACB9E7H6_9ASTR|nr:hypothetical protein L1987_54711 [Smallanthus sonchifolius]